ncbi:unnamed protein product [Prorocentrum cordatum]|uniref:Uncharacterized protein n=1 Tax=Prorocentrum cordatum TaxID=2364126 RepID=A0ABN9XQU3_9DINO|nr:unnamed protein product [Polarella glacialis]
MHGVGAALAQIGGRCPCALRAADAVGASDAGWRRRWWRASIHGLACWVVEASPVSAEVAGVGRLRPADVLGEALWVMGQYLAGVGCMHLYGATDVGYLGDVRVIVDYHSVC